MITIQEYSEQILKPSADNLVRKDHAKLLEIGRSTFFVRDSSGNVFLKDDYVGFIDGDLLQELKVHP